MRANRPANRIMLRPPVIDDRVWDRKRALDPKSIHVAQQFIG
jgi:hypothetical protein